MAITTQILYQMCPSCSGTKLRYGNNCPSCEGTGFAVFGNTTGLPAEEIPPLYPSHKIFDCTKPSEWNALDAAGKQYYQLAISCGIVDMTEGKNARTILWNLFGAETETRANLTALLAI